MLPKASLATLVLLQDYCGESLYVLVKAIKARLEKGPIDVITGEAKYSLSDERLLRHAIDPKVRKSYSTRIFFKQIQIYHFLQVLMDYV